MGPIAEGQGLRGEGNHGLSFPGRVKPFDKSALGKRK